MARCPNCGFDLAEDGRCPACGSGSADPGDARNRAGRRTRRIAVILGAGLVVAAALVVVWAVVLPAAAGRGANAAPVSALSAAAAPAGEAADSPAAAGPAAGARPPALPAQGPASPGGAALAQAQVPAASAGARDAHPPLDTKEGYIAWMRSHTGQEASYLSERWDRAQVAIGRGDVTHERVLLAFLMTPREEFCRTYNKPRAYADAAIPIGYGQTISGPHIVIRMTDALNPQPAHRVLEIGTGSGYQSAILSQLSDRVSTIEIVRPLYEETDALYRKLSDQFPMYRTIRRTSGDGYFGIPEAAPFDRIIVTAAIDHIPPELLRELAPNGIMVIPVGPPTGQTVLKITKVAQPDGTFRLEREDIYHGQAKKIFVPFTTESGGVHSLSTD